jgi:hypothetical protein
MSAKVTPEQVETLKTEFRKFLPEEQRVYGFSVNDSFYDDYKKVLPALVTVLGDKVVELLDNDPDTDLVYLSGWLDGAKSMIYTIANLNLERAE